MNLNKKILTIVLGLSILLNIALIFSLLNSGTKSNYVGVTYEKAMKREKPVILVFIANWCTFCQRLLPKLELIEKSYKNKFNIVVIDCEDQKNYELVREFSIKVYPTIFIVDPQKNTKVNFYAGYTENMLDFKLALDNYLLSREKANDKFWTERVSMSKLDELINKFCPNGVEYRKIKDIFTRLRGTPITAGKMKEIADANGDVRIYAGGKTVIDAKECNIPNANVIKIPSVLVQSRGIIDFIYYDKPFTFKNEMWAYTHENKIFVKFLYYFLKNNVEYFRNASIGMGAMPQISLSVTEDFKIPVAPIEVQEEIVRILDSFTNLRTKLTSDLALELTARKKQYEYYRDKLLTFKEGIPLFKVGEISYSVSSGKNKEKLSEGLYPVYGSTGIIAKTNDYKYEDKKILIARVGANAGYIHIANVKYDVSDNAWILNLKEDVNLKFIYYLLVNMNLNQYSKGGGQPLITAGQIKEIVLPIPPLEDQRRIVEILDRFDKLCNDISDGLPAEIEARKKQYEYYRDKLLAFKPCDCKKC